MTSGARRAAALGWHQFPAEAILWTRPPRMDGYEVARNCADVRNQRALIIAITGYGQQEDRALTRQLIRSSPGEAGRPEELGALPAGPIPCACVLHTVVSLCLT